MSLTRRRVLLGLGAMLLAGAWGATQYANEQMAPRARRVSLSPEKPRRPPRPERPRRPSAPSPVMTVHDEVPGRQMVYVSGYSGIAVGAGLIGFALLPIKQDKETGK